jgi:hypothetical protein
MTENTIAELRTTYEEINKYKENKKCSQKMENI